MHRKLCMPTLLLAASGVFAQPNVCKTGATPPLIRAEGLTERVGDILIACTGTPGNTINANITINLNTSITNRVSSASTLTGLVFTVDSGSGPQPIVSAPLLEDSTALTYNGVSVTFSPAGSVNLLISGIRANATQLPLGASVVASISVNNAALALTSSQAIVGTTARGLAVNDTGAIICAQTGSPVPSTVDFADLISAGSVFSTTRVTEGFADSFQPASGWANFHADSGERILLRYSGFPDGASLFVPDLIAGSDTLQPTSAGDFGLAVSGGVYAPSAYGSLLLARVDGADSTGRGGAPVYEPGAIGSGIVNFNSVTSLPFANGATYVVYEVVDANPSAFEYATVPAFLGLAPNGNANPATTSEQELWAPSSTAGSATSADPLPRFAPITPPSDCGIIGDCNPTPPTLSVTPASLQFSASQGVDNFLSTNLSVKNIGGGHMSWTATMNYTIGSGWLTISPKSGTGNSAPEVWVGPRTIAPNAYSGTLTIDAGAAGKADIPVAFNLTGPPPPTISSVVSAASFLAGPVVPGSLTTVMGTLFDGSAVSATFNNLPATILFSDATQINLLIPAALAGQSTAQVVVTVDGVSSAPATVNAAQFAPAIFAGGIVNQDGTVNSASDGAAPGSIIAIWATGLSGTGAITGNIGGQNIATPNYAGPAPGLVGVQQVNLTVPGGIAPGPAQVYLCGTPAGGSPVCGVPSPLTVN